MMASFKILPVTLLAIALLGFPSFAVSASTSTIPSVTYSAFVPAEFTISFPQTTIINVTVLPEAGGLYTYSVTTSPPDSRAAIYLNDSDIYRIFISFSYPVDVSGNTTWGLSSPGLLAGEGGNAPFNNRTSVSLDFTVVLIPTQIYPSADQIANATSGLLLNKLEGFTSQLNSGNQAFQNTISSDVNILAAMFTVTLVAVLILAFVVIRWSRHGGE